MIKSPVRADHSGPTLSPQPPAEALTHLLPRRCIVKDSVLEHKVSLCLPRRNENPGGRQKRVWGESNHTTHMDFSSPPHTPSAAYTLPPHPPLASASGPSLCPAHPTLCQPFRGHFLFLSRWPSCLSGMTPSAPSLPRGSSSTSHSSEACSPGQRSRKAAGEVTKSAPPPPHFGAKLYPPTACFPISDLQGTAGLCRLNALGQGVRDPLLEVHGDGSSHSLLRW